MSNAWMMLSVLAASTARAIGEGGIGYHVVVDVSKEYAVSVSNPPHDSRAELLPSESLTECGLRDACDQQVFLVELGGWDLVEDLFVDLVDHEHTVLGDCLVGDHLVVGLDSITRAAVVSV